MRKRRRPPTQLPVDAPQGISREPWFILGALLLALAAYVGLALLLMPSSVTTSPMAELFVPKAREGICPEPQERFLYVFGLCCIPALPTFFYWLLSRCNARFDKRFQWLENRQLITVRDMLIVGAVLIWLWLLGAYSDIDDLWRWLVFAMLGVPMILLLMSWKAFWRPSVVGGSLGLLALLFLASLLTVGEDRWINCPNMCCHFDLLLGAVNQVRHGRTVLVDTVSQYGILYPYVAALLLSPFRLATWGVEMFFVGMGLVTMIFMYLAVARKTGFGSLLSLLFFLGLLGVSHPFVEAVLFSNSWVVYYQYFPLRVVCGSFFLWFVSLYFSRKSRWLTILGYAAAGASVLWNSDTGSVIFIAWTGTLLFEALAENASSLRGILRGGLTRILLCGLTLLATFGLYGLFAWQRSGQFPRFENLFLYERIFFGAGFFMLPMNPWEFWQPPILIYLLTIFLCMRRLLRKNVDTTVKWYFFIALYGLGIFSYYQGRSDIACLPPVVYPAAMLSSFLAIDLWRERQSAGGMRRFLGPAWCFKGAALLFFLLLPAFGIVSVCRALPNAISYAAGEPKVPPIVQGCEPGFQFLRKWIGDSQTVIFSPICNYLHLKSDSYSALPFCSPAEVMLYSQVKEVQDVLDSDKVRRVVVCPNTCPEVVPYLRFGKFSIVAESEAKFFIVLEKTDARQREEPRGNPEANEETSTTTR